MSEEGGGRGGVMGVITILLGVFLMRLPLDPAMVGYAAAKC